MSELLSMSLAVMLAHALAVASPGPDLAIVLRQAAVNGRAPALWSSLGIGLGILVHVSYALIGLGLLIANTPALMAVIQLGGAAYLAWVGWQALHAIPAPALDSAPAERGENGYGRPLNALRLGFVTNVLNPKATLFFVALFSTFAGPAPRWLQTALGLWMAVTTAAWFSLVSLLMTGRAAQQWFARHAWQIDRAMGALLIALAAYLVWSAIKLLGS